MLEVVGGKCQYWILPPCLVMTWSAHNQVTPASHCDTRISSPLSEPRPAPGVRHTVYILFSSEMCIIDSTLHWASCQAMILCSLYWPDKSETWDYCDDCGDNKWAKLGLQWRGMSASCHDHCEIQSLKYTIKYDPDTRGRGDVIKFAYNLFPMSPCY